MRGVFIFEAVGNPKEAIVQFLETILKDIQKFEGIKILSSEIAEPIEKEIIVNPQTMQKVKAWSTFLELRAEFKDIEHLLQFILTFSPSMIDLEEDKTIKIEAHEFAKYLNDIAHRIIQLTMILNDLNAKVNIFANALLYIKQNNPDILEKLPDPLKNMTIPLLEQIEQIMKMQQQQMTPQIKIPEIESSNTTEDTKKEGSPKDEKQETQ